MLNPSQSALSFNYQIGQTPPPTTYCEVGFGAGHSALLWLSAVKRIHVISFDTGLHPLHRLAHDYLEEMCVLVGGRGCAQWWKG